MEALPRLAAAGARPVVLNPTTGDSLLPRDRPTASLTPRTGSRTFTPSPITRPEPRSPMQPSTSVSNAKAAASLLGGGSSSKLLTASAAPSRVIATITETQANFKVATREGAEDVLYIRKTSMRDRSAWAPLQVGNRVEIEFRLAAGRAIVSDAVPVS